MLARYIEQGTTLIERANLIGDASDYESWKTDEKRWIELTLHTLEEIYDKREPAEQFRSVAINPGPGGSWHREYERDAQRVQLGVDVLVLLFEQQQERQPEPAPAQPADADLATAFRVDPPLPPPLHEGAEPDRAPFAGTELAAPTIDGVVVPIPVPGQPAPAGTGRVFLVHGRNEKYKKAVADLLQSTGGYGVTILNERSAERRALVQHFDDRPVAARFAVVLLTGDDVGARRLDSDREPYFSPRARQGVVFELGVLVAVLTPPCICVLYEEGVELPCDLEGVTFVHLDAAGTWRSKLLLRLRAAGFDYDLNRLAPF
ncbi:MAG TPA: TIR domain-containing protein [Solirubrobacteraceae bacterium]|nr:TIR domain-containing protein [Solirubrobacteraceae bacterium]